MYKELKFGCCEYHIKYYISEQNLNDFDAQSKEWALYIRNSNGGRVRKNDSDTQSDNQGELDPQGK